MGSASQLGRARGKKDKRGLEAERGIGIASGTVSASCADGVRRRRHAALARLPGEDGVKEAVIFVGVQGAGKSTFYRERFFDTHARINLDMLRTRGRERLLLEACLEAGQSFVVDNTNPTAEDRARYIEPARQRGFRVTGYFFDVELRDAMRRNQQRLGAKKIPAAGVAGTFRKIEPPTLAEGFDCIYTVRAIEGGGFAVSART